MVEGELQGEPTSAEGRLLKELADRNDQWHVQKALDALHGVGRFVMTMQEHSDNLFTTNTEEGTKAKFSDWHMFLKVVYGGDECFQQSMMCNGQLQKVLGKVSC